MNKIWLPMASGSRGLASGRAACAALALSLAVCAASHAASFTLAIAPDVQVETSGPRWANRLQWLVDNRAARNIKFFLQVGDMMNFHNDAHYQHMSAGLTILDNANFPYATAIGNHDSAAVREDGGSAAPGDVNANLRNTTKYNYYFPTTRYSALAGTWEAGKIDNAYHTFSAGGLQWMVLNLELWPRATPVNWAKTVVAAHPDHNVIILTHMYLDSGGGISTSNGGYGDNSPQYLYDNLVKQYANIRMVFSGHTGSHASRTDTGVNGNKIYSFLQCYHDNATNPVRLLEIDTSAGTMHSSVYCPYTDQTKNDGSTFTLTGVQWVQSSTPQPPSAPSNLSASAGSQSQINLTWNDNSSNENGFTLERKTDLGGTWSTQAVLGAGATSHADNGLSASTTYYYRVRAYNGEGSSGWSNEASATTAPPPPASGPGTGILREVWTDVAGSTVADLTGDGSYPGSPDSSEHLSVFECPSDVGDNYGTRLRGYVIPPLSGAYRFFVAGDDEARLYLNASGEDPAGAAQIAFVPSWSGPREWAKYPEQGSAAITLQTGTRYYIEVLHKEGSGGDNVAVAWVLPGGAAESPVPGHRLDPFVAELRGPFGGSAHVVPGRIEVEDYDTGGEGVAYHDTTGGNAGSVYRADNVDIQVCNEGGHCIGWTDGGEWLEYTSSVSAHGTFDIRLRVASASAGGTVRVLLDGNDVTGAESFDATGGWQEWSTFVVPAVSLSSGTRRLRLAIDAAGFNLDYIDIVASGSAGTDTDADGLPDDWEYDQFGDLTYDGNDDPDGDSVTNMDEFLSGVPPVGEDGEDGEGSTTFSCVAAAADASSAVAFEAIVLAAALLGGMRRRRAEG